MKLVLPPQCNAKQFDAALEACAKVVGRDWVLATDADRSAYSDIYAPGSEEQWPASAAVAPATVEEVRAIVRLANEYKTPLWPVSRGKNLGYGAAAPRMPGSIVLDLGRMKQVLELDPDLAYCVIEPGVSFFDLYEHIQRANAPLWLSVPGNAWGSVLGNALDHGFGYTPYGLHARNLCGMEVVLPDGDLVHTGMGAMKDAPAWHLFPLGYGPTWDLAFTQSNFGVVTKAGMWLMPAPESSVALSIKLPNEEDIGWAIDLIRKLKLEGVIDQSVFIASWLGSLVPLGSRKDFWDKPSAIPEWRVQELIKQHQIGYWHTDIRLYGDEQINKARAAVISRAFQKQGDIPIVERWWHQGEPIHGFELSMGVPTSVPLQMSDWLQGRGAHMGFSPVVPAKKEHVLGQLARSRKVFADHDVDFYASFTTAGRFCTNINMLMFNRDDPEQIATIRKVFDQLIAETAKAGYGEYRTHLGWMDAIERTYDFNDHAMRRLNEKVKDALDPNGILAPGKQGVWPSLYREQATREAKA